jgi:hypothetical protein
MKKTGLFLIVFLSCVAVFTQGCVEPFSPPEVNSDAGYLVIDGFLNAGADTSILILSHTQSASAEQAKAYETGAKITVEEEQGGIYSFTEKGAGTYFLPPQQFNLSGKYRLYVKTIAGKEYQSDFVEVKNTPPIDSIAGRLDPRQDAMVMLVNTHDPKNQTQFYRWKFEETWEYRTAFYSNLKVMTNEAGRPEIVTRTEPINVCWRTIRSANILLGSTIKLAQDIIKDLPITTVPIATNKLYFKYSILVKQYGLSLDAFEYWTSLAKSTEITGSLFDPLPSTITGNIKNISDPQDLVFGYFSAAVEQKKRIFLTPALGAFPTCTAPDTLTLEEAALSSAILLNTVGIRFDSVTISSGFCADCRAQGGVTTKPSFWQ